MKLSQTAFAGAVFLISAPLAAQQGKVITFSFTKSELATEETRRVLLERMEAHSFKSCSSPSPMVSIKAKKKCAIDLRDQFLEEIDDEALTLLVQSESDEPFHTALR